MLTHVIGKPRSGKTSWVVAQIVKNDLKYFNWRYTAGCNYLNEFNKRHGTKLTLPPERHVVSANMDISAGQLHCYPISGFEFGMPNRFQPCKRILPYGVYVFDECQRYWPTSEVLSLPPWAKRVFELRGHVFLDIYLITQKLRRLHSDVRSTVDKFVLIEKAVHLCQLGKRKWKCSTYPDAGKIVKTTWFGKEFENEAQVARYLDGDLSLGKSFKDTFVGDIRSHYNPYDHSFEFEDCDSDFNYYDYNETSEIPASWLNYKKKLKKED